LKPAGEASPDDPYRAPTAPIDASADRATLKIVSAGRGRRFLNLLIDTIACWLLAFLAAFAYVFYQLWQHGGVDLPQQGNLWRDYAIGLAVMLLYYIPLEGLFGCTLGKLVTGTRVVSEDGGKPSWGQVAGRTFARLIPFEAFSVLFADDGQVRGWHDSLPRTWVVRKD